MEGDRLLSYNDMLKINPRLKFYTLEELLNFDSLDKIFNTNNTKTIIILIEQHEDFGSLTGHYVALKAQPSLSKLSYFNSYGSFPGKEVEYGDYWSKLNMLSKKAKRHIVDLMQNSKFNELRYNKHKLQGRNSTTCGRYCALFARYVNLDCDEFGQMIHEMAQQKGEKADKVIISLTNKYL